MMLLNSFARKEFTVIEVGVFRLDLEKRESLGPGEVGIYCRRYVKSVGDTKNA